MKIYKFGGASLKNGIDSLKNLAKIIKNENNLVIIISAIDKTTNALEKLVDAYYKNSNEKQQIFEKIKNFHLNYVAEIKYFYNIEEKIQIIFKQLQQIINNYPSNNYDLEYDSIVSFGEILSTTIVADFLQKNGFKIKFVDIRDIIKTDSNFRDSKILFLESELYLKQKFKPDGTIYVTQGFIGREANGHTTTLGREGSDYTAAAIGYLLDSESVTVWKDVPGIMNADPAYYKFAKKIDIISFNEAVELAFYGAKVIHPKTIKPLENKNIPLYVKSFLNPELDGTVIKNLDYKLIEMPPIFILKDNQRLISLRTKDFSFIVEQNISDIFAIFAKYKIKINLMQNSAVSFSVVVNEDSKNIHLLINELQNNYEVKYNDDLTLLTIRYYNETVINEMTAEKKILLEQKSRNTGHFVYL